MDGIVIFIYSRLKIPPQMQTHYFNEFIGCLLNTKASLFNFIKKLSVHTRKKSILDMIKKFLFERLKSCFYFIKKESFRKAEKKTEIRRD